MGSGTHRFQIDAERASCPNPAGDGSRQVNVAGIACGLVQRASSIQSTLSTFDTLALIHFLLTIIVFQYLRVPRGLALLLPWKEKRRFESIAR
jgi:hypothetical protein